MPNLTPYSSTTQIASASRFCLNLRPDPKLRLAVVCGGWEECTKEYVVDRPTYPYFAIEFVAAGTGIVTLRGIEYPLTPGTVFTYGPGVAHGIRCSGAASLVKYFVNFPVRRTRALLAECGLDGNRPLQLSNCGEVRGKFDELILLGLSRDQRTDRTCSLQLELLLHTIARAARPPTAAARHMQETFKRCRQYIDRHFLTISSVEQVAEACHLHKSHLCRVFREFHNESPLHYLQRLQMQWAADRLRYSGALVRQVADELGIDPFQFSRTFKRVHGLSPRALANTWKSAAAKLRSRSEREASAIAASAPAGADNCHVSSTKRHPIRPASVLA